MADRHQPELVHRSVRDSKLSACGYCSQQACSQHSHRCSELCVHAQPDARLAQPMHAARGKGWHSNQVFHSKEVKMRACCTVRKTTVWCTTPADSTMATKPAGRPRPPWASARNTASPGTRLMQRPPLAQVCRVPSAPGALPLASLRALQQAGNHPSDWQHDKEVQDGAHAPDL